MAVYGPMVRSVGSAKYPLTATGPHNFKRDYYRSNQSSGVGIRGEYIDLEFIGTIGGETMRLRGIANGTLCATGSTINALHATGRVASGKTVSGALNAIRATLEVAGTTPTPGGTLSALQVDVNASASTTFSANDAYIRVSNSGTSGSNTQLANLFNIEVAPATDDPTKLVSTHTGETSTHLIKCRVNGADMWLMAVDNHTA